ncbi:MAG: hypothetical protein AAF170_04960 [Bacteroidota bacterium]
MSGRVAHIRGRVLHVASSTGHLELAVRSLSGSLAGRGAQGPPLELTSDHATDLPTHRPTESWSMVLPYPIPHRRH